MPPQKQAACKRFNDHCRDHGWVLPPGRDDFTLSYDTNIPRQAGLSGSSALACAALQCLFAHYGVPLEVRGARVCGPALCFCASALRICAARMPFASPALSRRHPFPHPSSPPTTQTNTRNEKPNT